MAKKVVNTTENDVRTSVASLYSGLIEKRKQEQEERDEQKRIAREEREKEKEAKKLNEDGTKKSKKERRQEELDNWKEIIIGLTGDDLEYSKPTKKKKKYKKWIDGNDNVELTTKPKKKKKKNYNKEFEPEINMLKAIVADQNKFTADLQKRFNIAAGPATKDASTPTKTIVDLASAINAGRSNSLGILKEIGNLKKTIADLYMKQKKLDADLGTGGTADNGDIALMGSNIAASIFGDPTFSVGAASDQIGMSQSQSISSGGDRTSSVSTVQQNSQPIQNQQQVASVISEFDPSSWQGPTLSSSNMTHFENIPHEVVVEKNSSTGEIRFKAINTTTGEEIQEYPLPAQDVNTLKINEKDKIVKGAFDESYKLDII